MKEFKKGQTYFAILQSAFQHAIFERVWRGDDDDAFLFTRGLAFHTKTEATEKMRELSKAQEYPKKMWVRNAPYGKWSLRTVIGVFGGKYLAVSNFERLKEAVDGNLSKQVTFYAHARPYEDSIEDSAEKETN